MIAHEKSEVVVASGCRALWTWTSRNGEVFLFHAKSFPSTAEQSECANITERFRKIIFFQVKTLPKILA